MTTTTTTTTTNVKHSADFLDFINKDERDPLSDERKEVWDILLGHTAERPWKGLPPLHNRAELAEHMKAEKTTPEQAAIADEWWVEMVATLPPEEQAAALYKSDAAAEAVAAPGR